METAIKIVSIELFHPKKCLNIGKHRFAITKLQYGSWLLESLFSIGLKLNIWSKHSQDSLVFSALEASITP